MLLTSNRDDYILWRALGVGLGGGALDLRGNELRLGVLSGHGRVLGLGGSDLCGWGCGLASGGRGGSRDDSGRDLSQELWWSRGGDCSGRLACHHAHTAPLRLGGGLQLPHIG